MTIFFFRHEKQHIKLPWDLEDAKQLGQVLDRYKDKYFYEVLFAVFLVYILYPFQLQNDIQILKQFSRSLKMTLVPYAYSLCSDI